MKIVLVALYDVHSFGVRCLHTTLEEAGYDVHTVFFHASTYVDHLWTGDELDQLVATISGLAPDIVGISVRSPLFPLFKELSGHLRSALQTFIVAGGHHATVKPEECVPFADAVCVGEGEGALLDLCRHVERQRPMSDIQTIPNLVFETPEGITRNPLRPLRQNIDQTYDRLYSEKHHYLFCDPGFDSEDRMAVLTTRGCFFDCTFCYNQSLKSICRGLGRYVRRKSVDNVVSEIEYLKERFHCLKEITFADNVFTFGKAWLKEFCAKYAPIGLPFRCFSHFNMIDRDQLLMLKDAGCHMITIGIQSGSEKIRRSVLNRHETDRDIIQGSQLLAELGMEIRYDLIEGIPYETEADALATEELVNRLAKPYTLRRFRMRHFPSTRLTDTLLADGIITEDNVEGSCATTFGNWFHTN